MKRLIDEKSGISPEIQTLFFEEKCMPDEKLLADYPNISTGSAVYLAMKPLTIETLDHLGKKSVVKIPREKVPDINLCFSSRQ